MKGLYTAIVDASPLLGRVGGLLRDLHFDAVLIGNAAAGLQGFEGLRARAHTIEVAGVPLRVATLDDIIRSKRAAGQPRDRAVLEILEKSLEESQARTPSSRRTRPRK
jgi:hypothetical protein